MFTLAQSRTAPKELIDFAKSEIQDVLMNVRSVNYVMLCSTDGFELAHVYKRNGYNNTKLAAVSSSILAMVAAFMNEIHLEGCQSITLDADNGKAILTSIPSPNHPMIIVTLTEKDVLLGQLLYTLKNASNRIIQYQSP
ncbi:roadblock/LC7 domain-containing protein [Acinetobacter johnsonii]|jgi:predicted regulator of Ras-like GTPase activity (Roadblock/LC7/MglB family)|uniref:Roadblock/LC7 domain-containing protein n=1 Tax=Acinetobacter johnsonii TaxID=40214 RepID=A0AAJ6IEW8_ACIJO|nr:roadblock/LC7 domain-containing protein [Acinetobacter johnsonii]MDM1252041.1 roadblock/LC7 domain-containing protein [Acinetobacter johnsonii]UIZ96924.1 roadblock/LC7 domain-containing protein [Acinetobacter johnsonii]WEI05039.1 roadblock/LC7 domain-containing protein [Acinetobacter johnsonii]WMG18746.1 roadblock/LC7 domain-containing protein [Acinetobacter johnsonii]